jgi:hypothetical protein
MYTHELADALKKLANALKNAPNIDIGDLSKLLNPIDYGPSNRSRGKNEDLPIALSALVSLSRVDKTEWIKLISDLGLSVDIRSRDASRDIMGKVLRILETEPEARERLQRRVSNREAQGSPELARALSSLLNR